MRSKMRSLAALSVAVATVTVTATNNNNFNLSKDLANEISSTLSRDCGPVCVKFWNTMQSSKAAGESLQNYLQREMQTTTAQFAELARDADYNRTSYMRIAPCSDPKSCAALEFVANSCSYGRLAAMGTYQSLNVAVHTFGIVTKLTCACVDVYTVSKCFLRHAYPWPCEPISNLYQALLAASTGTWAAVKSTTSICKAVGDPRSFSFLKRPVLNLHVAETRSSFLESDTQQAVSKYSSMLDSSSTAFEGLAGLMKLTGLPNAKSAMTASSIVMKASRLAKLESTSDSIRNMCGSLITLVTGLPVVFQSSDAATGAYGHTNIVVPSPSRIYGA